VNWQGLPVRVVLTPGQTSDKTAVPDLLDGLRLARNLVADRGYDSRAIVELIEARGAKAHIPTQRDRRVQRAVNAKLYRQRNLIERCFNKLKHFRRIATRFEKLARNYLAAVLLASTRLWTRLYESTT
jgi:transposase